MSEPESLSAQGRRFAIVAARFNAEYVDRMVDAAVDVLGRHGATDDRIVQVRVPGSFELPIDSTIHPGGRITVCCNRVTQWTGVAQLVEFRVEGSSALGFAIACLHRNFENIPANPQLIYEGGFIFVEKGSPAARARFKEGDKVAEFEGQPIRTITNFNQVHMGTKPGQKVEIVIRRGPRLMTKKVKLGKA